MRLRYAAGAAIALATMSLLVAAASAKRTAARTAVTCGSAITASVTLTADLSCSGSDGLDVMGKGIVVNLNGHTISGDGTHVGVLDNGETSVTIENGVISDFTNAVLVENGSTSARLSGLHVLDSGVGLDVANSNGVIVTTDTLTGNATGVSITSGSADQVTSDQILSNAANGLSVNGVTGVTISGNKALNNTDDGIIVEGETTGTLSTNVASGNGQDGVDASGLSLGAYSAVLTIKGNRAAFNVDLGIAGAPPETVDGGGNVVQSNGTAAQCTDVACDAVSS